MNPLEGCPGSQMLDFKDALNIVTSYDLSGDGAEQQAHNLLNEINELVVYSKISDAGWMIMAALLKQVYDVVSPDDYNQ